MLWRNRPLPMRRPDGAEANLSGRCEQWGVVSTVSEPPQLVVAFVAHALSLGAAEVCLYLDEPAPDLAAMLRPNPRVRLVDCDAAHWRRLGMARPWVPALRQRANLQAELDAGRLPWLLHIDADEFLWGAGDIGAILAAQPQETGFLLVPVAERVHSGPADPGDVFAGRFRRQVGGPAEAAIARIDGPAAPFLQQGMAGYAGGKSFFRSGGKVSAGIHVPDGASGPMPALHSHLILHFDGLTPAGWVTKKRRMIAQQPEWRSFPDSHSATRNQLAAVHAAGADEAAARAVYALIKELDPAREAALVAHSILLDVDLDLQAKIAAQFPGLKADRSASAVDGHVIGYRPRRDFQALKHWARAVLAGWTGQPPKA